MKIIAEGFAIGLVIFAVAVVGTSFTDRPLIPGFHLSAPAEGPCTLPDGSPCVPDEEDAAVSDSSEPVSSEGSSVMSQSPGVRISYPKSLGEIADTGIPYPLRVIVSTDGKRNAMMEFDGRRKRWWRTFIIQGVQEAMQVNESQYLKINSQWVKISPRAIIQTVDGYQLNLVNAGKSPEEVSMNLDSASALHEMIATDEPCAEEVCSHTRTTYGSGDDAVVTEEYINERGLPIMLTIPSKNIVVTFEWKAKIERLSEPQNTMDFDSRMKKLFDQQIREILEGSQETDEEMVDDPVEKEPEIYMEPERFDEPERLDEPETADDSFVPVEE